MLPSPKTYRDLVVWQQALALVTELYEVTKAFPREEIWGLSSQLRRNAVSIPSNIAEGFARRSKDDYGRFLLIATGSLYEMQTQLDIAQNLGYLPPERFTALFSSTRAIEAMLAKLIQRVAASTANPRAGQTLRRS